MNGVGPVVSVRPDPTVETLGSYPFVITRIPYNSNVSRETQRPGSIDPGRFLLVACGFAGLRIGDMNQQRLHIEPGQQLGQQISQLLI